MSEPKDNRVPIMMSNGELEAIDDWRFKNRIATRSEAIRRLCQIAIIFDEKAAEMDHLSKEIDDKFKELGEYMSKPFRNKAPIEEAIKVFGHSFDMYTSLMLLSAEQTTLVRNAIAVGGAYRVNSDINDALESLPKLKEKYQRILEEFREKKEEVVKALPTPPTKADKDPA